MAFIENGVPLRDIARLNKVTVGDLRAEMGPAYIYEGTTWDGVPCVSQRDAHALASGSVKRAERQREQERTAREKAKAWDAGRDAAMDAAGEAAHGAALAAAKRAQASSSVDFMVYRTDALTESSEYRNAVREARTAAGREYEESTPAPNELVNPLFADRVELKRRWKLGEFADRIRGVAA